MRRENLGTSAPWARASPVLRSGLSDSMSNGRLRTRTSICACAQPGGELVDQVKLGALVADQYQRQLCLDLDNGPAGTRGNA
jgi:hypothetical protein